MHNHQRSLAPRCAAMMLVLIGGCGPAGKQPVHITPGVDAAPPVRVEHTGRIIVDCTPASAVVNVDGQDHGEAGQIAARGGLTLPRGLHRIEISLPGHRPFRFELILGDRPETIKVQLQPLSQPPG